MKSIARDLRASFKNLGEMVSTRRVIHALRRGADVKQTVNFHHYREILKAPFGRIGRLRQAGGELGARQITTAFRRAGKKVRYHKALAPLAEAKATKKEARYRRGTESEHCGICKMFIGTFECTAVEGIISPEATCDFFETARVEKAADDSFAFDSFAPEVQDAIRQAQDDLIQQLEDDARDAIDTIISDGVMAGTDIEEVAANVKDMIGLTDTQAKAALNYQRMLENLDPGALQRALRNTDFDAVLQHSIDAGADLSDDAIENMVSDYIDNYLDYRAATIAQTESSRAAAAGLHDAYSQAIDRGAMDGDSVRRHWLLGDNPCPICESIVDNSEPDGVGVDEQFDSEDGPVDDPPVHPSCECSVDYVTDLSDLPDDSEGEFEYQTQAT